MTRSRKRSGIFAVTVVALLLAFTAGAALAVTAKRGGGPVTAVRTATDGVPVSTQSQTYVDVPGMTANRKVPSGQQALLIITFSAESVCYNTFASDPARARCDVQVLVDGLPAAPGEVTFDSDVADLEYEANSMQFVTGPVGSGLHTITVQYRVRHSDAHFLLGPRTLTILRSSV